MMTREDGKLSKLMMHVLPVVVLWVWLCAFLLAKSLTS